MNPRNNNNNNNNEVKEERKENELQTFENALQPGDNINEVANETPNNIYARCSDYLAKWDMLRKYVVDNIRERNNPSSETKTNERFENMIPSMEDIIHVAREVNNSDNNNPNPTNNNTTTNNNEANIEQPSPQQEQSSTPQTFRYFPTYLNPVHEQSIQDSVSQQVRRALGIQDDRSGERRIRGADPYIYIPYDMEQSSPPSPPSEQSSTSSNVIPDSVFQQIERTMGISDNRPINQGGAIVDEFNERYQADRLLNAFNGRSQNETTPTTPATPSQLIPIPQLGSRVGIIVQRPPLSNTAAWALLDKITGRSSVLSNATVLNPIIRESHLLYNATVLEQPLVLFNEKLLKRIRERSTMLRDMRACVQYKELENCIAIKSIQGEKKTYQMFLEKLYLRLHPSTTTTAMTDQESDDDDGCCICKVKGSYIELGQCNCKSICVTCMGKLIQMHIFTFVRCPLCRTRIIYYAVCYKNHLPSFKHAFLHMEYMQVYYRVDTPELEKDYLSIVERENNNKTDPQTISNTTTTTTF